MLPTRKINYKVESSIIEAIVALLLPTIGASKHQMAIDISIQILDAHPMIGLGNVS